MELPLQERFTIDELAERWGKTSDYILSIADLLEFRIELFGHFIVRFLEFDGVKCIENRRILKFLTHLDFQFTTTEIRDQYNSRDPQKMKTLNRKVLGLPGLWAMAVRDKNKQPISIQLSAIYIPTKSVLEIEKRSIHRLVIEHLASHINKNNKITNQDFSKWVNEKYPGISTSLAKSLFTFLNLPL